MIPFTKMHGTGNDFVIVDCRNEDYSLNYQKIANRKFGIGCDQVIVLRRSIVATCRMDIYNADGSVAEMCGNAARCVIYLITSEKNRKASLELKNRIISGERVQGNVVKICMGQPLYNWTDIPLAEPCNTLNVPLEVGPLRIPVATNIGNPHVTFFVEDVGGIPLEKYGPQVENHRLFPNRVNASVAKLVNDREIKVRVWERGAGLTESCGSAACAAMVAATRRGYFSGSEAKIMLPGGDLIINFDGKSVFMTGKVKTVFKGQFFSR